MRTFETFIEDVDVEIWYEIDGRHRPARAHDLGWDPPEVQKVRVISVLMVGNGQSIDVTSVISQEQLIEFQETIEDDLEAP